MDPYKVLNLSQNSSIVEVKKAYEEVLKTYNIDDLEDNSFTSLYTEKINEANEAYRIINHNIALEEVRDLIDTDDFILAEAKLNLISDYSSSEWNFLNGVLLIKKGFIDSGVHHVKEACKLNPYNKEYQDTIVELQKKVKVSRDNNFNNKNPLNACSKGNGNSCI